ncbi:MAG TPA: ABATE domain-containing protein, partial [Longimicrobiales bacterium]|nr:ABATE domain-containing protein [Longimicrobiales bacterium]
MVTQHHTEPGGNEAEEQVGGAVCLELTNTASSRREGPVVERLHSYDDLVGWAERTGVLDPAGAVELRVHAAADPEAAAKALAATREFRESIYRVFSGRSHGSAIDAADLELIARRYAEAVAHRRLVADHDSFRFAWPKPPSALELPLWVAAVSAAELLVS